MPDHTNVVVKQENTKPALVFTGGGTAGHIMPCVALIEELKERFDIHYIGSKTGMERQIITSLEGVTYHAITTVKLVRSLTPKNLLIPFKLIAGIWQSRKLLKKIRPAAVFSKGGFVALPVAIAAKCPLVCHESDRTVGISNRVAKRKAVYFCTSFPETAKGAKNGVFTGSPIRRSLFKAKQIGARPVLLIMGGSLGAKAINDCVREALPQLVKRYDVIHITGKGKSFDPPEGLRGYTQTEFCSNMGELYAKATVAISRGGGAALFELAALKIPSVIIPLPKGVSRGDQIDNAEYFKRRGLCRVLYEDNLSPENLVSEVEACTADLNVRHALDKAENIDGTNKIAALLVKAAETNI